MSPKLKNILRFLVFLTIGVFFIWFFIRKLTPSEIQDIFQSFRDANYFWVVLTVPIGILSHYIRAVRWKMLLHTMNYAPKTSNVFFAVMVGYLANLAVPRLGEVSRCTILKQYEDIPFTKSFGTVITERVIDVLIFFGLFFLTVLSQANRLYAYIEANFYPALQRKFNIDFALTGSLKIFSLASITILIVLFFLFRKKIIATKFYRKLKNAFLSFMEGIQSLTKVKNIWLFAFYSLAIWGLYFLMSYLIFFSIPACSHLGMDAGLATLVFGSVGILLTPGGIGAFPAFVAETLALYGIASAKGYALGWLSWTSQNIVIVLLGIISLLLLPVLNHKKNDKTRNYTKENILSE